GIPIDRIDVVYGDTDEIPRGSITGGSRSVQRAGAAVAVATDQLVDLARQIAAQLLEAAPEDIVLDVNDGGRFHVAGSPTRAVPWEQVAGLDHEGPGLKCEADEGGEPTF